MNPNEELLKAIETVARLAVYMPAISLLIPVVCFILYYRFSR